MKLTTQTTLLSLAIASLFSSATAFANNAVLSTTTVTATGSETSDMDIPLSTITISKDELQKANGANIGDNLRGEPGVAVTNDGAWG